MLKIAREFHFVGLYQAKELKLLGSQPTDSAKIQWVAVDVTDQSWSYTFTYEIK
jgi:hypothetical protein